MIPKIVKSNPVPETIYKTNLKEIEEEKKKKTDAIKEETKKRYVETKVQRFEFETEKRPTNLDKLKEEAELKEKRDHEIKTFFKPIPTFDHTNTEIKMNAATILKEEAIIKRTKQEEEDYIKQVEMNMRDSADFEKWKKEMDRKEEIEKLELQERSN